MSVGWLVRYKFAKKWAGDARKRKGTYYVFSLRAWIVLRWSGVLIPLIPRSQLRKSLAQTERLGGRRGVLKKEIVPLPHSIKGSLQRNSVDNAGVYLWHSSANWALSFSCVPFVGISKKQRICCSLPSVLASVLVLISIDKETPWQRCCSFYSTKLHFSY